MTNKIILLGLSLVLIAGIYFLPRVVVHNENDDLITEEKAVEETDAHDHAEIPDGHGHSFQMPDSIANQVKVLRESFEKSDNKKKTIIFANSLARAYKSAGFYDSAAVVANELASRYPDDTLIIKAGDAYYEAFTMSMNQAKRDLLGGKARQYYLQILEKNPDNLDVKANLAMTMVSSDNPMQGIMMLREILEVNPDHEGSIFNLGMLSITSGQFDKAAERFKRLIDINADNNRAQFYYGYALAEGGKTNEAKEVFELLKSRELPVELAIAVENYLDIL